MRRLFHPNKNDIGLNAVLYAFSDPLRLNIVLTLDQCGERSCNALEVNVAKSTLSHHLKVLRESGVTNVRIEGTQHFLTLRTDDLEEKFPNLLGTIIKCATKNNPFTGSK